MKEYNVCLHKKGAHILARSNDGEWALDGKKVSEEKAISELVEAVQDLGYWCQVAKDVLPSKQFELIQEAYDYQED